MREILDRMYRNDIDGLSGNDDCGQMSAWYIFSVMGFYPVCPGSGEYVLGAPYLPLVKVALPNGRTLEIRAEGVDDRHRYVREMRVNGERWTKNYVTYDDIMRGGVWEFRMSASPDRRRGTKPEARPYSLTDGLDDAPATK